ncbi:helix-turn-helix transcriptional regulator [Paucibacter sp. APW11]|uniref:Helix-turn-helix transcriptional regulator n=1 Tax=Roseateles aquae TaxID=3077235 RepID=A0ABU3P7Q0_9BURK|nr:helix-turn-helix transcriptional regulator [Paucibacter sp. APW11]MDT8997766.1 helix-turn-helix transcriptional regulator [Paucibacter sp. APW11]
MLTLLLAGLTKEQRHALEALGIPHSRISEWKHGKRRPTLAQILALSMVLEIDPKPLVEWLAEQEANPAQLDYFRQVKTAGLGRLLTVVLSVGFVGAGSLVTPMNAKANSFGAHPNGLHIVEQTEEARAS